jgi:hypothetical protein
VNEELPKVIEERLDNEHSKFYFLARLIECANDMPNHFSRMTEELCQAFKFSCGMKQIESVLAASTEFELDSVVARAEQILRRFRPQVQRLLWLPPLESSERILWKHIESPQWKTGTWVLVQRLMHYLKAKMYP